MGFGALLRKYRLRAGQTQEELARRSGISARTISLLETGKRRAPRMVSARLMIDALQLPAEEGAALLAATHGTAPAASAFEDLQRFLPYDVPDFTGRDAELQWLLTTVRHTNSPTVVAIDGMAGVGKTILAVHAGHALAGMFPDGQYFLDLHGFTPENRPMDPADALTALLRMVGLRPDQIPSTLDGRAAAWRAAVAGRRVLIMLDNAAAAEQIRPVLPGGGMTVVTSRRRLLGLAGAIPLSLEVLPPAEAITLFTRVAGERAMSDGAADGWAVVAEIVALIGYLPLAIRLAAARFANRPHWTAADLLVRLRDDTRRLAELDIVGNCGVTGAFELSLQDIDAIQARMLNLLGRHSRADFDLPAVAALAGMPPLQAEYILEQLVDKHLLLQPEQGRYALHGLLRDYTRTLAAADRVHHTERGQMYGDSNRFLSRPA
jgi:transcriptional regulator with XRE-family HTH domain